MEVNCLSYYLCKGVFYDTDSLQHHGIKGMKWGVRRYQNPDGSLTVAGKKRLAKSVKNSYPTNKGNKEYVEYMDSIRTDLSKHYRTQLSEHVSEMKAKRDALQRVEQIEDMYRKSDRYKMDYRKAYDETLSYMQKNNPDYLNSIINKNNGKKDGLEKFHEFDTTMDGYKDFYYTKGLQDFYEQNGLSQNAWIDASRDYHVACRDAVEDIVGKYGNMRIKESSYKLGGDTVSKVIERAISHPSFDLDKFN